jgi:NAD(P)-dependent dehydrogenase (short-subunit alcohol dehydrogenase family)
LRAAVSQFGRVDIAVQHAAVATFGRFIDVPSDVFDAVVWTNVVALPMAPGQRCTTEPKAATGGWSSWVRC